MYIKFKKDHVAGFPKDYVASISEQTGARLVKEGNAEEIKREAFSGNSAKNGPLMISYQEKLKTEADKLEKKAKASEED